MKVKNSDVVGTFDHESLDSQNVQLKETVMALQDRIENYKAENEKVKRHYQELFDSIKVTRVQTIEKTTSIQNEIENLKTQLKGKVPCVTSNVATPKVFANAALKNELRKLKGNSMDTKFAKVLLLGKPPLQPSSNHLVVRQPNAFKSERPKISKPQFASQVDEKNVLSKPVTPNYLPKV
ncbi:hypothetical protein Tco_1209543 [Tanacetum coccineum]